MTPATRALLLAIPILLGGCTAQLAAYDAASREAARTAAAVADRQLEAARWQVCRAASIGAVMRAVGADPVEWERWARFCRWPADLPKEN